MKEGWKYDQMGNVCTFISGYTPAKELLSKSGSIPYYKVSDMNTEGNEVLLYKTSLYLSNTKKIIPQGSVVFPKNGGAIFTNKKRMLVCDSVVDLNTEAIFPNKNIVTTNFLYKLLLSIDLGQFDNGGGLPSINIKKMQSFTIPIPPLPEQERIVSLLDAEFAKIDAIKANAEKQLKEAKALFQSALKDYLTPKEGWEEITLKEIGKTQTGCTPSMSKKEFYNDEYMPFIKPSEINYDGLGGINYNTQMLSKLGAENGRIFQPHSIFMVCIGATISKLGISEREISCNQQINVLTPKDLYHSKFIYYAMLNPTFINLVKKEGTSAQATLPIISKGKWEQLKIKVPQYTEQQQIAEQLDKLSAKIKSLQSNFDITVNYCNDLKQSILKDIFS